MTRLLSALGSAVPLVDHIGKQYDAAETAKGTADANSMTLDELSKKVRRGDMLQSHSPAYSAAVQHIYGMNEMERQQSDTMSKLTKGELSFADPAAMDKYLVDQRNQAMAGQSQYTVAGFDKGWDQFGKQAIAANTRMNDAAAVARGTQEGTDSLVSAVTHVTSPEFAGTPADAARHLTNQVTMLDVTGVFALPAQRKAALDSTASSLAASGSHAVLKEFLASTLEGGSTVSSTLGKEKDRTLMNHALSTDDGNQHRRVDVELRPFLELAHKGELTGAERKKLDAWVVTNDRWVNTSTMESVLNTQRMSADRIQRANDGAEAQREFDSSKARAEGEADNALRGGSAASAPTIYALNKSGEEVPFDMKRYAEKRIPELVKEGNLNQQQEAMFWFSNNVTNPVWKSEIGAGIPNIASLGWKSDGKNVGVLNPAGQAALATYSRLHKMNPAGAEEYAGKDARMLSMILQAQEVGFPEINTAAALVRSVMTSKISDQATAIKMNEVDSLVREFHSPTFFSLGNNSVAAYISDVFGAPKNTSLNLDSISARVADHAKLLVAAGGMSKEQAVQAAVSYYANPAVTTRLNNTIYENKYLPKVPGVPNTNKLFEEFILTGPGALASAQGFEPTATHLQPNPTDGTFTAWVGGGPMRGADGQMIIYEKSMIEQWIKATDATKKLIGTSSESYEKWANPPNVLGGRTWDIVKGAPTGNPMIDIVQAGRTLDMKGYDKARKDWKDGVPSTAAPLIKLGRFTGKEFDSATTGMVSVGRDHIKVSELLGKEAYSRYVSEGIQDAPDMDLFKSAIRARNLKLK